MHGIMCAFEQASLSEQERFNLMVGNFVDQTGASALDLSADFNDFLRYKEPRGALCADFQEFLEGYEPARLLAA